MRLKFDKEFNEKVINLDLSEELKYILQSKYNWNSVVELDFREFTDDDLDKIFEVANREGNRSVKLQINSYRNAKKGEGSATYANLQTFEIGLKAFLENNAIRHWVFKTDGKFVLPYLVSEIVYYESDKDTPAHVVMYGRYNGLGKRVRGQQIMHVNMDDIRGKTIPKIFYDNGIVMESEELLEAADKDEELCLKYRKMVHKEFLVTGEFEIGEDRWTCSETKFNSVRCVNEEDLQDRNVEFKTTYHCWGDDYCRLPIHPYVYLYSLVHYNNITAHVSCMRPYAYDDSLKDKLVLPKSHSDLLDILTNEINIIAGDIIQGKSGGTTILCCGAPGLGKTLTAECYSEITHRPLYKVNSGQLGVTAADVEKNLEKILKRAARWKAVMLIDEADTYIRKRGDSLDQNAVVAAFLRTLEYFDGLLFMTTNRFEDVDDAIVSRCIATVTYNLPDDKERKRIWQVLSTEFQMGLSDYVIESLVKVFPKISGRDIKELLKLTGRYIKARGIVEDKEVIKAFISCAQFRAVEADNKVIEELFKPDFTYDKVLV